MLVSHTKKFIFTKTAKTGGTSVETAFQRYCIPAGVELVGGNELVSDCGIVGARGEGAERSTWWNHMPARQIKRQLGDAIWQEYFKFTIVRNPYDKVVSWFHFQNPHSRNLDRAAMIEMFNSWIADERNHLPNDRDKYLFGYRKAVDRVIRYENLASEVSDVADLLHCEIGPLPRLKAQHRQDVGLAYHEYYEPKSRERVERDFAFELEAFGYTFLPSESEQNPAQGTQLGKTGTSR